MLKLALALGLVVVAWFALLVFVGVAPLPHLSNLTPTVLGELSNSSGPLAAIPIRVVRSARNASCDGPFAEVTSADNGRFAFAPARELNWFIAVMAHGHFEWNLCVKLDGQWHFMKSHDDYALVDSGPEWVAIFRCNVEPSKGAAPQFICEETLDRQSTEDILARWLAPD